MNFGRGLFRLWLVFGVLFALCVNVASFHAVREEFRAASRPADKVVEIPNFGKVAFPGTMSDDEIGAAIRKNVESWKQHSRPQPEGLAGQQQTVADLGKAVKQKFPKQFDDVPDVELGIETRKKFQGQYDDFVDMPAAPPQQTVEDLGKAIKQAYPKQFDDVSDIELGRTWRQAYPGKFDDVVDMPAAPPPQVAPGPSHRPERPRPWVKLMETAGIAFGLPVAILALGWSLIWAFSGFRASPKAENASTGLGTQP